MELWGTLRQWTFPAELRIPPAPFPPDLLPALRELAARLAVQPARSGVPAERDLRTFAELGTSLWRLRNRLVDRSTRRPIESARHAFLHLEAMWDTLREAGIEIQDHDGERLPEGGVLRLKAVAYQPTAGLARETVLETIRPTISAGDRLLQMGEVVVGVPEHPQPEAPRTTPPR